MKRTIVSSCVRIGGVVLLLMLSILLTATGIRAAETPSDGLNRPREIWVAIRDDGKPGAGTVTDPFDGGTVAKLDGLFDKFTNEYGDNLTIHFGPGVFYGDRRWVPRSNWKIRGAGMDITVFKTQPNSNGIEAVGFRAAVEKGFEISDVTFDFNVQNLRRPNRFFVSLPPHPWSKYGVTYVHVDAAAEWSAGTGYKLGQTIRFQNSEFIALRANQGKSPVQGDFWSVLRSTKPAELPAWDAAKTYGLGEAVVKEGRAYMCIGSGQGVDPLGDVAHWQALDPDAIDPEIYTFAVFIGAAPPGGGHRATRVKAINGNGSLFFEREAFLIWLAGDNCVIEDCVVEQFHGDYGTLIANQGQNNVVRGCVVRGNDGQVTMAYGGWGCWNTIFEHNFCSNVRSATNIDSLNNRNVTFRGNVFLNCREIGILVNVSGVAVDGKTVAGTNPDRHCMDGLYIYDNYVEMRDSGEAIKVLSKGLSNVVIHGNTLRTISGSGRALAIGVSSEPAIVYDNLCETNMYSEIVPPAVVWRNNVDLLGQPMKDFKGQLITGRSSL